MARLAPARFRTVFDVGANIGEWTRAAASAWPDCRFHCFEPIPETCAVFAKNLPDRACLNGFGLSDEDGSVPFFYSPESPDITSDRDHGAETERRTCAVKRGDDYCREKGIARIDFLKIDVEGAEHRVLKGFAGMLGGNPPPCIQFEYGAHSIESRFLLLDYYAMLANRYQIGKIHPYTVDFRPYDWMMEDFRFANYLCVLKSEEQILRMARACAPA